MPLEPGQLQVQREYIRNNPRSRLLRTANRQWLQPRRGGIDTALPLNALMGYLRRECAPAHITPEIWVALEQRLLKEEGRVGLDTYGNRALLARTLLPVCCHRRDKHQFQQQKARCIGAARGGAVLVSARIACGEQEIMDAAIAEGWPVVLVADNGLPPIYHPSADRTDLCADGRLLIVSPWHYTYRRSDQGISEAECKAMNCVAQALCRLSDDWWEGEVKFRD